ncbi:hypothetical protein [Rhizobium jaguaris]|uniref:Uncharacterized protein n=1 Tax=Rhizobium jaguaris TaxID=1312183 RepID=A0A387FUE9_9HYPH|nr:hypothetical protein [Rhizobium jaguaris]AYG62299.1 hypothetical protein CCGE525_26200 [Rhizobium jaguaris]
MEKRLRRARGERSAVAVRRRRRKCLFAVERTGTDDPVISELPLKLNCSASQVVGLIAITGLGPVADWELQAADLQRADIWVGAGIVAI